MSRLVAEDEFGRVAPRKAPDATTRRIAVAGLIQPRNRQAPRSEVARPVVEAVHVAAPHAGVLALDVKRAEQDLVRRDVGGVRHVARHHGSSHLLLDLVPMLRPLFERVGYRIFDLGVR